MFRTAQDDKLKSLSIIKRQHEAGAVCSIPGCGNPLSNMTGPGSDCLCREHQLAQREYGGPGRIDRLHTFHRKWVCAHCGKDVSLEVSQKYPNLEEENPKLFNRLCRNRIIADHKVRKADGGDDSEDNVQSLCLDCNSDKTILNEDWRKAS
jgi:hypothetical protein